MGLLLSLWDKESSTDPAKYHVQDAPAVLIGEKQELSNSQKSQSTAGIKSKPISAVVTTSRNQTENFQCGRNVAFSPSLEIALKKVIFSLDGSNYSDGPAFYTEQQCSHVRFCAVASPVSPRLSWKNTKRFLSFIHWMNWSKVARCSLNH